LDGRYGINFILFLSGCLRELFVVVVVIVIVIVVVVVVVVVDDVDDVDIVVTLLMESITVRVQVQYQRCKICKGYLYEYDKCKC
jgi:hypothetical protein